MIYVTKAKTKPKQKTEKKPKKTKMKKEKKKERCAYIYCPNFFFFCGKKWVSSEFNECSGYLHSCCPFLGLICWTVSQSMVPLSIQQFGEGSTQSI
jgi:hypothetical protein